MHTHTNASALTHTFEHSQYIDVGTIRENKGSPFTYGLFVDMGGDCMVMTDDDVAEDPTGSPSGKLTSTLETHRHSGQTPSLQLNTHGIDTLESG